MIPAWLHRIATHKRELLRLRISLRSHPSPNPPSLEVLDRFKAIWRVNIPDQPARFMSVSSGAINQEAFVVHLDAQRFYYAWLKASPTIYRRRSSDCICREKMPSDSKYKWAVDGFSHKKSNPVPLAEAGAHIDHNGRLSIGFTNGVTRTFWLLANRCPAFPVEVYGEESARLLHEVAGLGSSPISLADLFAADSPLSTLGVSGPPGPGNKPGISYPRS